MKKIVMYSIKCFYCLPCVHSILLFSSIYFLINNYYLLIICLPNNGAPFLVHETKGFGIPVTFPSKMAFPPWANLAFLNICSNTGGAASFLKLKSVFFLLLLIIY